MTDNTETVETEEVKSNLPAIDHNPIMQLLELAINKNADIDKLERLMTMKREWDAEEARKAYIADLAAFQGKCPTIIKSKDGGRTNEGQTAYKYAPIDKVMTTKNENGKMVKELLEEYGFSYSFNRPEKIPDGIKVIMTIAHRLGHTDTVTVELPFVVKTGVMSPPQVYASTSSYAKRYAFLDGFGIMTGDEDNDAAIDILKPMFEDAIKEYGDTAYIRQVEATIETPNAYKQFLDTLPTTEQALQLKKLLTTLTNAEGKCKYNPAKVWETFQKCTKTNVQQVLFNELK